MDKILKNLLCGDQELSLLFVDDDAIREINRNFLNRDYPTNVISFSMREGEFAYINPHVLGDIVISAETALRDAREAAIPFEDEIVFLMIHGLLHLLGYDHEGSTPEDDVKRMEEKERDLFSLVRQYMDLTGKKKGGRQ